MLERKPSKRINPVNVAARCVYNPHDSNKKSGWYMLCVRKVTYSGGDKVKAQWLVALLMLVSCAASYSQEKHQKTFGDYTVYYNLVKSTFFPQEITDRYNVSRDEDTSLLSISVRAPNEEGKVEDAPSEVSGQVKDLIHVHELDFKEFEEPNAVYYLAEVTTSSRTELNFNITISPENTEETYHLTFSEFILNLQN